eukprot:CAMPEP_0206573606 /NCGR_PEP_ID=MMETSP0325_2-20121206/28939_1 /ASSEMBLY_ACC=CAM_ASM_000347 /TAXON_ID=2866 /ORGANISM="Crypthecodinium cohnii, Strain Seligo" /LENGTH=92 /DNA_ID=CAMNT_0054078029 /DNA_START=248 /DNA_END=523 /DNA_ORIENTATION=-
MAVQKWYHIEGDSIEVDIGNQPLMFANIICLPKVAQPGALPNFIGKSTMAEAKDKLRQSLSDCLQVEAASEASSAQTDPASRRELPHDEMIG